MSHRDTIRQVNVTGPITLGDPRWLVAQCEDDADDPRVSVQPYRELGPMDHDPEKITVHVDLPSMVDNSDVDMALSALEAIRALPRP